MSTASDLDAAHGRDPWLDFYRGLGMLVILIAHIPINGWALWIPARFGFSDATEIFVFCSGMASAIAFGRVFDHAGWFLGTARIALRVWQVYWAHITIFVFLLALMVGLDAALGGERYVRGLYLHPFFATPKAALLGLLTLGYVPNYFDILPMYLVILALVPVVMGLAHLGRAVLVAWVLGLWAVAGFGLLDLPAEPWSARTWFFNPFSWQLIFFAGFAFARGWLAAPPITRRLISIVIAVLLVTVPFAWHRAFELVPTLGQANAVMAPLIDKTHLGALRVIHFLALAYLAYAVAGERGRCLRGAWVDVVQLVGRQSLAVFLT
ncbi:MAG TPA: OpgC domain-containing protein, partial [Geminicoccaceae bacterium]|nr:OpgC domain-containing protein [Geminicoccaceae bacterium]